MPTTALAIALCLSVAPAAVADQGHSKSGSTSKSTSNSRAWLHAKDGTKAFPSQNQVDAAKARATRAAQDVGRIKASLLLAQQRLDHANIVAEQASEAYNGAMWHLQQAQHKLHDARRAAVRARRTVAKQRGAIANLVVTSYQQGDQLSSLNALMGSDGPVGVLNQYAAFQGASTSLQADYQRFAASDALAQVFAAKAVDAKAHKVRLAAKARSARAAAESAAQAAVAEADSIAAERDTLIHALARAQNISVSLANKRQSALEAVAKARAEARARRAAARAKAAAEARARAAAAARARARARARAEAAAARARAARRARHHDSGGGNPTPSPPPSPKPPPNPPPQPPPPPTGGTGVARAIAFAEAQLGEPYQWGGAGPDSWDCSGLTMQAWAAAGVYLPHYAAAQYYQGTPIPVSSAQRGDLLFWSTNGAPSGIHHVALYLGNGRYIEAPHTGAYVRISSLYYWYPNFAVRL
jgi:cell wall-associated NlpC family hydrolase